MLKKIEKPLRKLRDRNAERRFWAGKGPCWTRIQKKPF